MCRRPAASRAAGPSGHQPEPPVGVHQHRRSLSMPSRFRPARRRRLVPGPLAALLITMMVVLTQASPAEAAVTTWGRFDFYENPNAANNNLVLKWISIREVDGNVEP